MNMPQSPTPEMIKQWAASGAINQLETVLAEWQQQPEISTEAALGATAVSVRIQLGETFSNALNELSILKQTEPVLLNSAEIAKPEDIRTQASSFEQHIKNYLQALETDVASTFSEENKLKTLLDKLRDPNKQPLVLRQIANSDPEATAEWLVENANRVVSGVKENLWDVVSTGRDVVATAIDDPKTDSSPYIEDWGKVINHDFGIAEKELTQATDWLLANNADKE